MKTIDRIVVALDLTDESDEVLKLALTLAGKLQAELALVTVLNPGERRAGEDLLADKQRVGVHLLKLFDDAHRELSNQGAPLPQKTPRVRVEEGPTATVILEAAESFGAELIVMGTHCREGLTRAVLGSVSEEVIRHAACPVTVLRTSPEERAAEKYAVAGHAKLTEAERRWRHGE